MPQQIELRNIALQAAQPLVHGVSLTLQRGRVLALVGGSGSGKSLTCAATLGILPAGVRQTAGEILADGKPVSPCALRGIKIATIMQNPRSAFNPLHTMHTHARETCLALGKPADDATLTAAIEAVGLENAARVLKLYPFEMSGGMLQRHRFYGSGKRSVIGGFPQRQAGFTRVGVHGVQRIKGTARVLHDGGNFDSAQGAGRNRFSIGQNFPRRLANASRQNAQRRGAGQRLPAATTAD